MDYERQQKVVEIFHYLGKSPQSPFSVLFAIVIAKSYNHL